MTSTKRPEFKEGHPIWWHHHGWKIRFKKLDLKKKILTIRSRNAAIIRISPCDEGWHIEWAIKFGPEEKVKGVVWLSRQNLECAFGLSDEEDDKYREEHHDWLVEKFGADCAWQGAFIRFGNFLNIPGPGTGSDGDPNISIELDGKIKEAVLQLLGE